MLALHYRPSVVPLPCLLDYPSLLEDLCKFFLGLVKLSLQVIDASASVPQLLMLFMGMLKVYAEGPLLIVS